jgi:hypothetical protein
VTVCLADSDDDLTDRLAAVLEPYSPDHGPHFKWDHWHIFGGDGERALRVRPEFANHPRSVRNPVYPSGESRSPLPALRCDGGPKFTLDLTTDRNTVHQAALRYWDTWWDWARRGPLGPSFAHLVTPPEGDLRRYPRTDWVLRPAFEAWYGHGGEDPPAPDFADPRGPYGYDRDDYAQLCSQQVNTTGALLQLDGAWIDDESFGESADYSRYDRYYAHADNYLNSLEDTCLMVRVAIHY